MLWEQFFCHPYIMWLVHVLLTRVAPKKPAVFVCSASSTAQSVSTHSTALAWLPTSGSVLTKPVLFRTWPKTRSKLFPQGDAMPACPQHGGGVQLLFFNHPLFSWRSRSKYSYWSCSFRNLGSLKFLLIGYSKILGPPWNTIPLVLSFFSIVRGWTTDR